MKKRIQPKELLFRLVIPFLLLCLIVYTVYHALGDTASSLSTIPAREITDTRLLSGEGWLFRDETILTVPQEGIVCGLAESGTKVGKNGALAEIWTDASVSDHPAKQKELDEWNAVIRLLESSIPNADTSLSESEVYRDEARASLQAICRAIGEGNWGEIEGLSDKLLISLNRYNALTGDAAELEDALKKAKQERDALLTGTKQTIYNEDASAYYYSPDQVDGYESLFSSQALEGITYDTLTALQNKPPVMTDGTVAGKLCYGHDWHLVAEFDGGSELFEVGQVYPVAFPDDGMELELECVGILIGMGDDTAVIFRSEVTPSSFSFSRSQEVTVTVDRVQGFYVPESALVTLDGEIGVYVFEESTLRFCRIHSLYREEGYVIVSKTDPAPEHALSYLGRNDLIVTAGKNLYHGKVYT